MVVFSVLFRLRKQNKSVCCQLQKLISNFEIDRMWKTSIFADVQFFFNKQKMKIQRCNHCNCFLSVQHLTALIRLLSKAIGHFFKIYVV